MRIAYFTPSAFSTQNAGALRNLTVAQSLTASERHTVDIIHPGYALSSFYREHEGNVRFVSGGLESGDSSPIGRIVRYRYGPVANNVSQNLANADVAISYNPHPAAWRRLRAACTHRGIPLIVDLTEWLDSGDLPGPRGMPFALTYQAHMRRLPHQVSGGIAVSTGLAEHLEKAGARAIVVPPLHAPASVSHRTVATPSDGPFRVLVSGSALHPSGKDGLSLRLLSDALVHDPHLADLMHVHVAGRLEKAAGTVLDALSERVAVTHHGWLPLSDSLELLRRMDALLLVRDPESRRLRMGFPSKVTEAATSGVLVVANNFSDMAVHFPDGGWTAIRDLSGEGVADALHRAIFDRIHMHQLPAAARQFTPEAYADALTWFVEQAVGRK